MITDKGERGVSYIEKEDTNRIVTVQIRGFGIGKMVNHINDILLKGRNRRKVYMDKEERIQNIIKNALLHGKKDIFIGLQKEGQQVVLLFENSILGEQQVDTAFFLSFLLFFVFYGSTFLFQVNRFLFGNDFYCFYCKIVVVCVFFYTKFSF